MPEETSDKLELPEDWPYFFLSGTSLIAIDPLLACLKTTHKEWKVRDIKSGKAVTAEWIDDHIQKNDGWEKKKKQLMKGGVVVLLHRKGDLEPLASIKKRR